MLPKPMVGQNHILVPVQEDILRAAERHHVRAAAGEPERERQPDAAGGAGDEGDAAREALLGHVRSVSSYASGSDPWD